MNRLSRSEPITHFGGTVGAIDNAGRAAMVSQGVSFGEGPGMANAWKKVPSTVAMVLVAVGVPESNH